MFTLECAIPSLYPMYMESNEGVYYTEVGG